MIELWVIASLVVLNIAQFAFWSWQNQMLVNKIMCKDLAEYKHLTEPPKEKPPVAFEDYEELHEENEILAELNGMISGR